MKRWLFVHGFGRLSKEYSALSQQTEKIAFLAREFVNYLDVLEDKNAQQSVQRMGLLARKDVTETSTGKLVSVTDENRQGIYEHALSMYIGEKCKYCGYVFETVEEIIKKDLTKASSDEYACHICWDNAQQM